MTDQIEMPEEFTAPRGAGPQLRYAREKAGLSVADVAARTRISPRHVADLETGNYAAFTSRTYALGFARTIAKELGLDPEVVVRQVRGELNALQPAERAAQYETSDPARVPSQSLVWFSVLAAGLLLAGLFFAYRTLFSPAAELPSLVDQEEAEQAAAATASGAPAAAPSDAAASGPVVFTATAPAVWVRFSDASGARLYESELSQGQSYTVPADANGPVLLTARPEALSITIGGRAVPPIATEMQTVSNVKVDAASLLARPAPAATPSAAPTPGATPAPLRQYPLSQERPAPRPVAARPTVRPTPARATASATPDAAQANSASAEAARQPAAEPASPSPAAAEPAPTDE